jgi:hypothetical protein
MLDQLAGEPLEGELRSHAVDYSNHAGGANRLTRQG